MAKLKTQISHYGDYLRAYTKAVLLITAVYSALVVTASIASYL